MKASVVDLRYKMNDILRALDRNEEVTVLYHGKIKGIIVPAKKLETTKMRDHPFFGMLSEKTQDNILNTLDELRKPRYQ